MTPRERATVLAAQVSKTWDPPVEHGNETPAQIAQSATMLAIAFIHGVDVLPRRTVIQQLVIDAGLKLMHKTFGE